MPVTFVEFDFFYIISYWKDKHGLLESELNYATKTTYSQLFVLTLHTVFIFVIECIPIHPNVMN